MERLSAGGAWFAVHTSGERLWPPGSRVVELAGSARAQGQRAGVGRARARLRTCSSGCQTSRTPRRIPRSSLPQADKHPASIPAASAPSPVFILLTITKAIYLFHLERKPRFSHLSGVFCCLSPICCVPGMCVPHLSFLGHARGMVCPGAQAQGCLLEFPAFLELCAEFSSRPLRET